MQRQALADGDRGGQLGGHRGLRIHPPPLALGGGQPGAAGEELGHHRQLARTRRVLGPHPTPGRIDQRGITQPGQVGDLRQHTIEHTYETTHAA